MFGLGGHQYHSSCPEALRHHNLHNPCDWTSDGATQINHRPFSEHHSFEHTSRLPLLEQEAKDSAVWLRCSAAAEDIIEGLPEDGGLCLDSAVGDIFFDRI